MNEQQISEIASDLGMVTSQKQVDGKDVWFFERDGYSTFLRDTQDYKTKDFRLGINNCSAKLDKLKEADQPKETSE